MPKSKAEMMRKLREARRDAGLVPVTYWLTPGQKKEVDKLLKIKKGLEQNEQTP
jgi:hypothetical protein